MVNAWFKHLMAYKRKHKAKSLEQCMKDAKKTYHKKRR